MSNVWSINYFIFGYRSYMWIVNAYLVNILEKVSLQMLSLSSVLQIDYEGTNTSTWSRSWGRTRNGMGMATLLRLNSFYACWFFTGYPLLTLSGLPSCFLFHFSPTAIHIPLPNHPPPPYHSILPNKYPRKKLYSFCLALCSKITLKLWG